MAHGFKKGVGSANPLNFKVVIGKTEPENPVENMIWINTSIALADWHFSNTRPENPVPGTVWICIGKSSGVSFNALKDNELMVYPIRAERYTEGITDSGESYAGWDKKEAKIYQNGEWREWSVFLYNCGDACDDITGGYEQVKYSTGGTHDESSSMNADSIHVKARNQSDHGTTIGRSTANAIDLTNIQTIYAVGKCTSAESGHARIGITANTLKSVESINNKVETTTVGDFTLALDVSSLSGLFYIIPYATGYYSGTYAEATFTQIWYE